MDEQNNKKQSMSPAQAAYFKTKARLDEELGPSMLDSKLSEKDLKEAMKAAEAGKPLYQIHPRLSEEELQKIVTRAVEVALAKTTVSSKKKIVDFLVDAIIKGMMGNATWDIMKHFIPHLHNFFNSADISDLMRRSGAACEEVQAKAPPGLRNFSEDHLRGLLALRVKTWRTIGNELKKRDSADGLRDVDVQFLCERLESYLFCPVRY